MSREFGLFSDASYDPKSGSGIGGILILSSLQMENFASGSARADFDLPILMREAHETTSSRLEMETVLWVLREFKHQHPSCLLLAGRTACHLYTDCQTAVQLPQRRAKLEANHYGSKRSGQLLGMADLYREFFNLYDEIQPHMTWIKGHKRSLDKSSLDDLFSTLDQKVRRELRKRRGVERQHE